jgi:hypothetical protein
MGKAMIEATEQLLAAFDGHDIDGVRAAIRAGADARSPIRGKEPVFWLLAEYTRSDRLAACLRMLLDEGAQLPNRLLTAALLDDADAIAALVEGQESLHQRITLASAFTSLSDVTLLHVAAEYGNTAAARALIELGADVNAAAGVDEFGIGGHTPIFHTVNSNRNRSEPVMRMLAEAGADPSVFVRGLYWGKGYPWETVFFDVTPISFAQFGLMPQVHRSETDTYQNINYLLKASGRPVPDLDNIPNRYLLPKE